MLIKVQFFDLTDADSVNIIATVIAYYCCW